jgi:hypothetical protein
MRRSSSIIPSRTGAAAACRCTCVARSLFSSFSCRLRALKYLFDCQGVWTRQGRLLRMEYGLLRLLLLLPCCSTSSYFRVSADFFQPLSWRLGRSDSSVFTVQFCLHTVYCLVLWVRGFVAICMIDYIAATITSTFARNESCLYVHATLEVVEAQSAVAQDDVTWEDLHQCFVCRNNARSPNPLRLRVSVQGLQVLCFTIATDGGFFFAQLRSGRRNNVVPHMHFERRTCTE